LIGVLLVLAIVGSLVLRARRSNRPRPGPTRPGRPAGRSTRPRGATAPTKPKPTKPAPTRPATGQPRPGEIWWAEVPYEDGSGSKVRPCLVLRTGRAGTDVLKITSQDKSNRTDHIRIPTKAWDPDAGHDSYLDLTDPIRVAATAFEDRAGSCEPKLWREVQKLHDLRPTR
jgi:hypothetical protein